MFTRNLTNLAMVLWLASWALSGAGLVGCGSDAVEEVPEIRILAPADGAELCADRPFFAAACASSPPLAVKGATVLVASNALAGMMKPG